MKKTAALAAFALATMIPIGALGETVFAGEVTASNTQVIAAPFGGMVEKVSVRVGDSVKIGDPIAVVETTKVYAETDGTVSGVFASEGDSADGIKTRYGGLVYIEPINRYTLSCSTEKAYNSSENRYIHIGESIYLKCTKDGSHQGRGIVTAIDEKDESKYTVEVTGGEFYMGETVDIYRNSEYETASRIGRGTVGMQHKEIPLKMLWPWLLIVLQDICIRLRWIMKNFLKHPKYLISILTDYLTN
ncbi:MAG: biotin/lipoyl-binding protein [Christensenellales bacterium]